MFTQEEKQFLISILESITIKPSAPDAENITGLVRSVLNKLSTEEDKDK